MSLIVKRGTITQTPHTEQFTDSDVLALEEIHGSYGFSGPWTRKMHKRFYPTEQIEHPQSAEFNFKAEWEPTHEILKPYLVQTGNIPYESNALFARTLIAAGSNTRISVVKTKSGFPDNSFYRNCESYELFYVQEGSGVLHSEFGRLEFGPEDYVMVPKGTTYRIEMDSVQLFLLLIESRLPIEWPEHYMNQGGQASLSSPVVETEIGLPDLPDPVDQRGKFPIYSQHDSGAVSILTLGHHPFDVVGWEGALYPFTFNIHNHHGIAKATHSAPPQHNTFQAGKVPHNGFSLCSFVPQPNGWHPKDVPAPYAHYNVDSDELMFFCNTAYEAREGVLKKGSFTVHPGGLPHSPHGEAAKKSLAARGKMSNRLAVMLDTYFENVKVTKDAMRYCEADYPISWSQE